VGHVQRRVADARDVERHAVRRRLPQTAGRRGGRGDGGGGAPLLAAEAQEGRDVAQGTVAVGPLGPLAAAAALDGVDEGHPEAGRRVQDDDARLAVLRRPQAEAHRADRAMDGSASARCVHG